METVFHSKEIEKLDSEWEDFRGNTRPGEKERYRELMVRTFPVLYKFWNENDRYVDKDIARLLCTMSHAFDDFYDLELEWQGTWGSEIIAMFHKDFMDSILVYDSLTVENGVLLLPDSIKKWKIKTETFELPNRFW